MFSWRLAMAPPEVLRYVVAHEVAHLVELNHSARFWALVERLDPGHAPAREWLRRRGAELHGFDFRPPRTATEAPGA
jgi:predicted metal-dependent hydrolase